MRIKRKTPPALARTFALAGDCWIWIFGTGLFLLFGSLMLQTSEDISTSLRSTEATKQQQSLSIVHGATTCQEAKENVNRGDWYDPNQGKLYARETVTQPHFYMSLHDESYDAVRWKIFKEGKYYEDTVHARFVEILQHHPARGLVLDVGANIGYYTMLSSALGHDVIAFEPNPANVLRMCESLNINGYQNQVTIVRRAISDVDNQEMTLMVPRNPGQAFLKPLNEQHHDIADDHQAKTKVMSLDGFEQEQGWLRDPNFSILLLKVDVEGKEPQVFLGSPKLLQKVKHVLTEGRRFGRPNVLQSFTVLFDAGFVLKEPKVVLKGTTPKEHAQSVVDHYLTTLGHNSQRTTDLWWVKN